MAKKKTTKTKPKTSKIAKVKKAKKKVKNAKILPVVVEEIDIIEIDEEKKPDSYEEHGCEFVNESDCEEDGLDLEGVEKDHFNKDEEE